MEDSCRRKKYKLNLDFHQSVPKNGFGKPTNSPDSIIILECINCGELNKDCQERKEQICTTTKLVVVYLHIYVAYE